MSNTDVPSTSSLAKRLAPAFGAAVKREIISWMLFYFSIQKSTLVTKYETLQKYGGIVNDYVNAL